MSSKMKKKSIIILTEGGQALGFGHITRTISIISTFEQESYNCHFLINGDKSIENMLIDKSYEIFNWLNDDLLYAKLNNYDYILLDSILVSNEQIKKIEALNIPIIFIDDDKRRNILDSGFVIDWTVLSDKKDYFLPKKENVKYLLGSQYTPLRDEFSKCDKVIIDEEIKSILITFGGSDIRNLTPKILKILNFNFPNMMKNIIIGGGYNNIEEIKKYQDDNTNLLYNVNAKKMSTLMQSNDLAIASGGQTLYELALVGLPTLAIIIVDNAIDDTKGWAKVGFVKNLGWYDNDELNKDLVDSIKFCQNNDKRKYMQKSAINFISKNGAQRIYNDII